jgi:phosphoribosyl 1,2-cyclic phosphodiesterase
MSLYVSSLNSGSNGNCYYIGNDKEAILVDAGISCRETEKRMQGAGLEMASVKAIFITHEHSDHIKGLETLSSKYQLPVFITDHTYKSSGLSLKPGLLRPFHANTPTLVGELEVKAFRKFHDACDPHSFMISYAGIRVGVFTDIGRPCEQLVQHFSACHAAFLESNYDATMLENGRYPWYLKNRIRNGQGHLSNDQALELFLAHRQDSISHLFLSHLSKENNCPILAKALFEKHAGNTKIVIASRDEATPVYTICAPGVSSEMAKTKILDRTMRGPKSKQIVRSRQLQLEF